MPTIETTQLRALKVKYDALKAEHCRLTREIELRDRTIAELEKHIAANRKKNQRR